jgi:hypothetical protein
LFFFHVKQTTHVISRITHKLSTVLPSLYAADEDLVESYSHSFSNLTSSKSSL